MAISTAATFGKNATTTKMDPMMIPTRLAPIPVTSASEMLDEYVVFGNVPNMPDRKLPTPSALREP